MSAQHSKWVAKKRLFLMVIVAVLCPLGLAYAGVDDKAIGGVAKTIISNFGALARLITAGSYIAGFAFSVGAILKFKAHKDNPTQIPIGTPIALIFIAAALIFLPSIFTTAGHTLFGSSGQVGGVYGQISFSS